jgi:hypothetical protein
MEHHLKKVRIPVYVHLRPTDPNFVPEHLDKDKLASRGRDLQTARREISFEKFLADVLRLFDASRNITDDPDGLPGFELVDPKDNRTHLMVPEENVLDLWQALRLRGAIDLRAFPGVLNERADFFAERLKTLDYLEPMTFGLEQHPGLRYAPPSTTNPPVPIDISPQ